MKDETGETCSPADLKERLFTNKSKRPGDDTKEALRTDGNTTAWQAWNVAHDLLWQSCRPDPPLVKLQIPLIDVPHKSSSQLKATTLSLALTSSPCLITLPNRAPFGLKLLGCTSQIPLKNGFSPVPLASMIARTLSFQATARLLSRPSLRATFVANSRSTNSRPSLSPSKLKMRRNWMSLPRRAYNETNLSSSSALCRFQYYHQCPARYCPSGQSLPLWAILHHLARAYRIPAIVVLSSRRPTSY